MRLTCTVVLLAVTANVFADGAWLTCTNTGAQVWNPAPQPGENVRWEGAVKDGKANGPGTAFWSLNDTTTERVRGDWKDGKVEGYAVWVHPAGDVYEGQWTASARNGYGVYTWKEGRRFLGFYENNTRGVGRMFGPDGRPLVMIPTSAEREAMFAAQDAAIAARKSAARAELVKQLEPPATEIAAKDKDPADK